jgi:hypothetical protein
VTLGNWECEKVTLEQRKQKTKTNKGLNEVLSVSPGGVAVFDSRNNSLKV